MIQRIVSGAQTGVDRAALDAALELGIECGGWAPLGRLDECGRIPDRYPNLVETDQANPAKRTALNVRDSDATLILSRGPLTGGSLLTERKARGLGRPCLHVDLAATDANDAVREIRAWLASVAPACLNVAGPRASKDPEIYGLARQVLQRLLAGSARPHGPRDEAGGKS